LSTITISHPEIGALKSEIDTPALCVDLGVLDSNIDSMAATCSSHNVAWRPHCKCHKSSVIAKKVIEAGAIGITCAKLGEAEVMAAGGVSDLLIANMIVGQPKLDRLVQLRRVADPIVCIDHPDQAKALSEAMSRADLKLRTIAEVDIGLNRVGIAPGEQTVSLAKRLAELPGLTFSGIMGYEGHLLTVEDQQEKTTRIHEALDTLVECKSDIESVGIDCESSLVEVRDRTSSPSCTQELPKCRRVAESSWMPSIATFARYPSCSMRLPSRRRSSVAQLEIVQSLMPGARL